MTTLSTIELARVLEFGEAEAYVDMFAAAPSELGLRVERIGQTVALMASNLPIVLFNRVIGLGIDQPATESAVTDIVHMYSDARIPTYGIQLGSVVNPPQLSDWLRTHRFAHRGNWAKIYCKPELTVTAATDLRIERVGREHAPDCARVTVASFGMPPLLIPWLTNLVGREGWQHFIAFDGQAAVAAGALFIKNRIGWVGMTGTLSSHRKRGAQAAIIARSIAASAQAGCDWVIAETDEDTPTHPNPSYHNMLRTGFSLAYQRANYIFASTS
jgi:hypothetical protein